MGESGRHVKGHGPEAVEVNAVRFTIALVEVRHYLLDWYLIVTPVLTFMCLGCLS